MGWIYADIYSIMEDMKTKQWNRGDKVTPIEGFGRGVPCEVRFVRNHDRPSLNLGVTVRTVHGATWHFHPNNLKSIA